MSTLAMTLPGSGVHNNYSTIVDVGAAMQRGEIPIRADGSPFQVTDFMGGVLLDGYPLNVVLYGVWYPGQQEVLQQAGYAIPLQAAAIPITDPIPEPGQAGAPIDWMSYLPYIGIGLIAWKLFK